ncbi:MAG: hypothetical protein KF795_18985 [Labilithrix sp.]|nr:hypothetical protein [Labilithrix sp.]
MATAIVCVLGTVTFAGCTADGTTNDVTATEPEEKEPSVGLPPSSSGGTGDDDDDATAVDAGNGKKDGGKSDGGADAGKPPPTPGDSCATLDTIVEKTCGACGKHSTVCLADDQGQGSWSVYSACTGELAGGCVPGESVTEACGNCGTRVRVCSKFCALSTPACTGQPVDSCSPGTVELTSAGCASSSLFRARTCRADCSAPGFSDCAPPPTTINVAPTVGSISSTVAVLTSGKVLPKLAGTCPNATVSTTISTPYQYIQVRNTLAKTVTASIYSGVAPGGVVLPTTLASYAGAVSPTADEARKACEKGTNSLGTSSLTGDNKHASLDGTRKVTIPAGGTVTVFVAARTAYDAAKPADSTGPVKLNVRTETVE